MWSLVKQQPASAPWWGSPVALESPSSANDRSWKESPCQRRSDRRPWCLTGLDQGPQTVYQTKNEWSWLTQLFRYILPIIVVWFSNRKSSGWWFQSLPSIPDGFSHPINQDSNEFPLKVAGYRLSSQLSGRRTSTAPVGTRILSETMADLWLICGFAATMLDVAGATNHAGASLAPLHLEVSVPQWDLKRQILQFQGEKLPEIRGFFCGATGSDPPGHSRLPGCRWSHWPRCTWTSGDSEGLDL
jgi:hypothetical protein